jgi:molybdate transport system substrate-binding protein
MRGKCMRWAKAMLLAAPLMAGACASRTEAVVLTVSAASDLTYAFQEIGPLFQKQSGVTVAFNFGSTGQLTQQIEAGAPVDVFAAANLSYLEDLERRGLILPDTKVFYARGRLVLWIRADGPSGIEHIEDLRDPSVRRIAIANPEHAPYGVAAREALQSAGLWGVLQPRLVMGENVRQTLQYAETGNVDVALVALSLVAAGAPGQQPPAGRWSLVPEELHRPLDQALAVIRGCAHEQEARAFAAFVNEAQGRQILKRYGFTRNEEVP